MHLRSPHLNRPIKASNGERQAFTLTEMLVVLAIIGLMAAVILPSLPGLMKSNVMTTADRQLLDDLAYARQRAINDHTKVYMVFVPAEFWTLMSGPALDPQSYSETNQLVAGQYTTYALFSFRSVGDQPGQSFPKYLTGWKSLPDGVVIKTNKFGNRTNTFDLIFNPNTGTTIDVLPFAKTYFPFPQAELVLTNSAVKAPAQASLPYIAFDSRGQLVSDKAEEYIPLVRASILAAKDPNGANIQQAPDIVITDTNFNLVRIDRLTGRAKLLEPELR